MGVDTDTYKENIPVHIRHLLDIVSEDDPLHDSSFSKPCPANLKGKMFVHCNIQVTSSLSKTNVEQARHS
jgi:hypothetical protein